MATVIAVTMTSALLTVLPATQASAAITVACGDVNGPSGLVGAFDLGNRSTGSSVTVQLAAGCVYTITEAAWDFDSHGNRISYDSAFWPMNDRNHYGAKLIVEGNGATITISPAAGRIRFADISYGIDVELRNLTFSGGLAAHGADALNGDGAGGSRGGAIDNAGNLVLDGVTFANNAAGNGENGDNGGSGNGHLGGYGGDGGAIYNGGSLTVKNGTFTSNVSGAGGAGGNGLVNGGQGGSGGDGGAIFNAGTLTVIDSTFTSNSTGGNGSSGGGIYGGPPGFRGAGGAIGGTGPVTVSGSLFRSNTTAGTQWAEGGAIDLRGAGGSLTVTNSTFSGNTAWRGGAIHLEEGSGSVKASTFVGNDATGTGDYITGDVAALDRGSALTFANTLMVGNDPGQVDCNVQVWDPAVTFASAGGLMSDENNGCGTNTVIANAQLSALGSWGGATQSYLPGAGSPALGAGVSSACLPTDQRGVARPATGCDIGAVERSSVASGGSITGPTLVPLSQSRTYATTSTAGGGALDYTWSVSGVSAGIGSATAASPSITFTTSGVATVSVNIRPAHASADESVTQTLTVKVPPADNVAPAVTWVGTPPTTANEGDTKRFTYAITDSNGNPWSLVAGSPTCGASGIVVANVPSSGGGYLDCLFPNGAASSTVSVTAEDNWSAQGSATRAVSIAEVAPSVAVTGASSVNEGSTTTFAYSIVEPGSDLITPITTCVGTGSSKVAGSDSYASSGGYTTVGATTSGTFQCRAGNGPGTLTPTVAANGATGSTSVGVVNVAPTVAIGGPTPVVESGGSGVTYSYAVNAADPSDAGNLAVASGSASCGGTAVGTVISADPTTIVCRFLNGPAAASVAIVLRDPDGATSTGGALAVQVTNAVPVAAISQPTGPVAEGGSASYSLVVTDAGADTLTVTPPAGCAASSINTSTPGRLTAIITCSYPDGPLTVSKTITVSDGTTTATATVTGQAVTDVHPTATGTFDTWDSWEGDSVAFHIGSVADPGVDTPTSVTVDWGDGTTDTYAWPLASADVTHVYNQDGVYFATVAVTDEDATHPPAAGARMVVHAGAPVLTVTPPTEILEGVPARFDFTTGLTPGDTFTVEQILCGRDESFQFQDAYSVTIDALTGSFECLWNVGERDQDVRLWIRDSDGLGALVDLNVRVANRPAVVTWTSGPEVVYESDTDVHRYDFHASDSGTLGMIVMTYSLYGGLSLMYGCGNGELVSQVPYYYGGTVPGVVFDPDTGDGYIECKFRSGPGTGTPFVTIGDWMSETTISREVTVLNAAPVVTVTAPSGPVVEGSPTEFSYSVSDVNDAITVDAIDCGVTGVLQSQTASTFTCLFPDGPASPTATITVSDGELTDSDAAAVSVLDAAPTAIALTGAPVYTPGLPYELTIGAVTDAGDDTVTGWTIDWGDGSSSVLTSTTPAPIHVYAEQGQRIVSVGVTNEDGTFADVSSLTILHIDDVPPVLSVPADFSIEADRVGGVYLDLPRSATDDRDGGVQVWCNGQPVYYTAQFLNIGEWTFDCSAADSTGNTSTASFTVTVTDTQPPHVNGVADIEVPADSATGTIVTYATPLATDVVDWQDPVACAPASGTLFALGDTTVTCSATDATGNTGSTTFTVSVVDEAAPVVASHLDIDAEAEGPDGATLSFTAPTANDAVDGAVTVTCVPASGSIFPLGETTVTCSATDTRGNTGTAEFTVSVADTTAPDVAPRGDIEVPADGPSGTVVTFATPTAVDDVSLALSASCAPASGITFPLGDTTVTCSATDAAGNTGSTTFTVSVVDHAPPVVTASDVTVRALADAGTTVTIAASATDAIDGSLPVTCDPASGSLFAPESVTSVDCSATDAHGNTGTTTVTVTVSGAITTADHAAGDTEIFISAAIFEPGDYVIINEGGADEEVRYIEGLGSIVLAAPLAHPHLAGTTVSAISPPPLGDTTAPVITFAADAFFAPGTSPTAPIACSDGDGVGVQHCDMPALDTSTLGAHTVAVRAWDFNGNVSARDYSYTVAASAGSLSSTGAEGVGRLVAIAIGLLLLGAGAVALAVRRRRVHP